MHCPPRDDMNDNNDKRKLLRNWHEIYRVKGRVNNKNVYILRLNEQIFRYSDQVLVIRKSDNPTP